ncbi:MAG: N-acetyltransferase family protein [Candidatus Aenigmatarchaeota archaeon]
MEIRKATKDDVDEIVEKLWKPFMQHHQKIDEKFKTNEDAESIFKKYVIEGIEKEDFLILVAKEGKDSYKNLVGYLIASVTERAPVYIVKRVGMINDLFVKEDFRGRNLGEKLFKKAEEWLIEQNIKYIKIKVAVGNGLAQDFWNKKGFENFDKVKYKKIQ